MVATQELTQVVDRERGFRNLQLIAEDSDSRDLIIVTHHHAENIALAGDAPSYMTLPELVASNERAGKLLLKLACELLDHPHLSSLAERIITAPGEPVPFAVEKPNCHED